MKSVTVVLPKVMNLISVRVNQHQWYNVQRSHHKWHKVNENRLILFLNRHNLYSEPEVYLSDRRIHNIIIAELLSLHSLTKPYIFVCRSVHQCFHSKFVVLANPKICAMSPIDFPPFIQNDHSLVFVLTATNAALIG